ncbi:MAG: phosphatidylethanolamine N-methyltransferase family protein, partial [Spirochaetota bacterium]|nr:phosphatidylethanolamine N-methyltransferase family protein [Spirochaetota bacterium]
LTGQDHFDGSYAQKGLELRGIFKYIPNSMYTVLFLALYHPGLYWDSLPGLLIALCHHIMVGAHYFCTEKPDMKEIYGK